MSTKTFNDMTVEEVKAFTRHFIDSLSREELSAFREETGYDLYNNLKTTYLDDNFRPIYPIYEREMDRCFQITTALTTYKFEVKNLAYEYEFNIYESTLTKCVDHYGYALAA